jgi:TRAP-type C4-dicarboxylate transport system permease small subunit
MGTLLDKFYTGAAYLAGIFMVGILVAVIVGILGRLLNFSAAGMDAYAGYSMAASAFLALAHTLRRREHIRVTLLLNAVSGSARLALEVLCYAVGALIAGTLAWFSGRLVWQSYLFNDISTGLDATPLWIPQIGMALGATLLFVAFVHEWTEAMMNRRSPTPAIAEQSHVE